jgi:hypothetical protein
MKNRRERCTFSHDFKFFGYVTYRNKENLTRFEVHVCKKCGLSEFFFAGIQKNAIEPEPETKNMDSDEIQDLSIG